MESRSMRIEGDNVLDQTKAGVYAASLTPMYDNYQCNHQELVAHCHDLINRGCRGVLLFGTTGEGPSLPVKERATAIKELVRSGIDPQKLMIGVGCSAIEDTVELVSTALDHNCSTLVIPPPFYYKNVDDSGVITFYREVIQRVAHSDWKLFLYHIPQYSGVPITLNIIKALREEFPTIVTGIKESEGNLSFIKEILLTLPSFKLFVGRELQIAEAVKLGGMGGISGMANAFPELICSLFECGKDQQKPNHHQIVDDLTTTLRKYPLFPALKSLVENQKGTAWHILRPPLTPLDPNQSRTLIQTIKQYYARS